MTSFRAVRIGEVFHARRTYWQKICLQQAGEEGHFVNAMSCTDKLTYFHKTTRVNKIEGEEIRKDGRLLFIWFSDHSIIQIKQKGVPKLDLIILTYTGNPMSSHQELSNDNYVLEP